MIFLVGLVCGAFVHGTFVHGASVQWGFCLYTRQHASFQASSESTQLTTHNATFKNIYILRLS